MRTYRVIQFLLPLALISAPAAATTVSDASDDFLPTYVGPHDGDLDVTSFSVNYDSATSLFTLGATFAGTINPSPLAIYAIGVNTGTGPAAPFAALGQPNVRFNQVIVINSNGTGSIGATTLDPASITISGNTLGAIIPWSLLPTTGFAPANYGFNLWPRIGLQNNNQIADFAPENATLADTAVPEPASWAMMIAGFGAIGGVMRRRGGSVPAPA